MPGVAGPGRGLVLLSGGFDSPVAARMLLDRGWSLEAVHYSLEPVADDATVRKARELCRILGIRALHVVKCGTPFGLIAKRADPRYYFVLSKRLMVRVAEGIARERGLGALVTGESLGQVSSQTLQNLAVIDQAATMPVARPLIGFDKQEIIDRAKAIGTYEASQGPEVCDMFGPRYPATRCTVEAAVENERVAGSSELVLQSRPDARLEQID
jgi:thiamine biosynthesis protein ThiI